MLRFFLPLVAVVVLAVPCPAAARREISSGSWIASSPAAPATNDPGLLGEEAVESFRDGGRGTSEAFGYTATTSGIATDAEVYLDSTSGVTIGLYADHAGKPGARLDVGTLSSNNAGWVDVPLRGGVKITAGTRYWIDIAATSRRARIAYRDHGSYGSSLDYLGAGTQDPFSIAGQRSTNPASAYINGTAVVMPPPSPPTRPPPTAAFSFSPSSPVPGQAVALNGSASTCNATPCSYHYIDAANNADLGDTQTSTFTFQHTGTKFVQLTVTDANGNSASVAHDVIVSASSAPPPPPQPSAPTNTSAPMISGTPTQGYTLAASSGTWTGSPTLSYAWSDGQSGQQITLGQSDVGNEVSVTVTAVNSTGSATASSAAVGPVAPAGSGGGTSSGSCTQHVTTTTFASAFGSAGAGSVLCLAPGTYGAFHGGSKPSPGVTITADPSAGGSAGNVKLGQVTYSGSSNITLDNLTINGVSITGSPSNLVVSNSMLTSFVDIENIQSTNHHNVLFNRDQFTWATSSTCEGSGPPGLFFLGYGGAGHSGVTVENSIFANGDCDGIHTGTALDILNNTFSNLCETNTNWNHTDNIQFEGAVGGRVAGNYVHEPLNCITQGITSYDGGTTGVTIEDNVIDTQRFAGVEWYGDKSSVIRHNTVVYRSTGCNSGICGYIDINCKPSEFSCGSNAAYGTQVYDNLAIVTTNSGATTARNDHNVSSQSVSYQGGPNPPPNGGFPSFAAYLLVPGSAGVGMADDGSNLGVTGPA